MSLKTCINELHDEGKLTDEQARRAHETFDEIKARHRQSLGEAAADAAASEDALAAIEYQAARDRESKLLAIAVQRKIIADVASYDGGQGDKSPAAAALAVLDHDGKATYDNVAVQKQVIIGRAHAIMERVLATFSRDLAGNMRNPAVMTNVLRELFGKDTGDAAAKELAQAWTATAEMLRQKFNSAGGAIGKIEHWGLPQSHDGVAVREAGYDAWRQFIGDRLDRSKMIDSDTGQLFTDAGLERLLKHVFDTVTTEGWIRRNPGAGGGRPKLANMRADHRYLHFDGADKWLEYNERFGNGSSPFDTMVAHVDGMARDIALMERLGPNPPATVRWLQDGLRKDAAIEGRRDTLFGGSAEGGAQAVGKLYDLLSGKSAMPVNAAWARGLGGTRDLITSAKLGSAIFSSLSDPAFQLVTRKFNGLPILGAITDHLAMMAHAEDREGAVRLGLIAGEASRMAGPIHRYTGESMGPGVASRLADGVLRTSGLSPWTQTGKWSYGMGELARATGFADRRFGQLPEDYRSHLERYGIDAGGWDGIRQAERLNVRGADFINPTAIADQALGDRLLRMILTETSYAVPEVTARSRAMMSLGQPGTVAGEVGRSAFQFKSFGVSMVLTHGRRAAALGPYGAAKYGAALFVSTTLLGAVQLQCKEIVKGRGLRRMDGAFWMQAISQGSGFGIFGDLAQSQVISKLGKQAGSQRFGSLAELLAGPVIGAVADGARLGIVAPLQDAGDWWEDRPYQGHTAKEGVRFLKNYLPGVNLWYTRAAFERLVLDQLQGQIDPNHQRSWSAMERHAHSQGQDFWWKPGEPTPDGLPQMAEN